MCAWPSQLCYTCTDWTRVPLVKCLDIKRQFAPKSNRCNAFVAALYLMNLVEEGYTLCNQRDFIARHISKKKVFRYRNIRYAVSHGHSTKRCRWRCLSIHSSQCNFSFGSINLISAIAVACLVASFNLLSRETSHRNIQENQPNRSPGFRFYVGAKDEIRHGPSWIRWYRSWTQFTWDTSRYR